MQFRYCVICCVEFITLIFRWSAAVWLFHSGVSLSLRSVVSIDATKDTVFETIYGN